MRIVLLYPPPWKIPAPGEAPDGSGDGPPAGGAGGALDGDFHTIPYGLLSLAAQAMEGGHQVKVFNLSMFPWPQVEELLRGLDGDVYGLTCFTANRRGVGLTAACIRRHHPAAHIVVGGPHVSALPAETLRRWQAVDTVVIGEAERTFMELLSRLEAAAPTAGIAGTAWRDEDGEIRVGPARERIADLDGLAKVHEHFASHVLLTSRGCPGRCTFCASNSLWGQRLVFHSVEYVLDEIEAMLARLPLPTIAIKDDTFTAGRKRALRICQGIRQRGLSFLWSCDTRVDAVDEELLRAMRLAGCEMVSFGVESASPKVLRNIGKRIVPEQVVAATRLARRYGLRVRYYMMAGNRGETLATFQQSLEFLVTARPDEFLFCVLSIYPGTTEFELLRRRDSFLTARPGKAGVQIRKRRGPLGASCFFDEDFMELWAFPDTSASDARQIGQWLLQNPGIRKGRPLGAVECKAILDRLPDHPAAHLDLGAACAREGMLDEAERHVRKALELGYPIPSLAHNVLACIAGGRGDLPGLEAHLGRALEQQPPHPLVAANAKAYAEWASAGGPAGGRPLRLVMRGSFETVPDIRQPILPTPVPPEACVWPEMQPVV